MKENGNKMKKNEGECVWKDHCIMGKNCPGDDACGLIDNFFEKLAKGELPCLLVWAQKKDNFCNLLPLTEHTISIAKCNDGKNCFFAPIMKNVIHKLNKDNALISGAQATNQRSRVFFEKYPQILLEKIHQIEELCK